MQNHILNKMINNFLSYNIKLFVKADKKINKFYYVK